MTRSKIYFIRITASMAVFLFGYLVASLYGSDAWGNILSPVNALLAAGILIFAYLRSQRTIKVSVTFLLYALACIAWGIADIVWAGIAFSGGSPDENPITWVLYVVPNCFFLFALVIFAFHQFRKWDIVQFSVDLIINALMIFFMFWIVFLRKDMTVFHALIESDFTSILSIATDVIICILIFSWILSVRSGKIPAFLSITSIGMVLFSWTDLLYYYLDYSSLYVPNTLIDFLYILSMVIIAFGTLWKTYKNSTLFDFSIVTNVGGRRRWIFLLLYPFLAILIAVTGAFGVQVNIADILIFMILIAVYWASCKYIQLSLEKEALLKQSNDLLEQRVAEQVSELTFLANQDTLTTLFNRRYFMTCLDETIRNKRESETVSLLLIDLDRFKTINDAYGHDVGDHVLIDLSYRLIAWNSYGAALARLGGDEFAVMFAGKYTQKDVERFCTEIIDKCSKPLTIGKNKLSLTISVGIAMNVSDECDGKTLLQNADIAMYRAKSQGYNKYQVYNAFMNQEIKKALEIEALLRQTDVEKDFELFYQPQYALPGKELIGAEALIRWKIPQHGYIPPNVFIPIAEQIDFIFKIGKWVMQEAIRQAIKWNSQDSMPLKIGINISAKQFQDECFISFIKNIVTVSKVNPEWIDVEITESVMIDDGNSVNGIFSVFRELGITVSIDDFGSGYSALGYLNKYPVDRIKIDKSLIDNVKAHDISGANIIKAAVNMAHASGIQAIAEGVETQEQLDILVELGCDQVQGYLLGRPVPADIFETRYLAPRNGGIMIS